MLKINRLIIASLVCISATAALAQSSSDEGSTQTVETLLRAENRSVIERDAPLRNTTKTSNVLSITSIYGAQSNMRVDGLYGDVPFNGARVGSKVGPFEIGEIQGICAYFYAARSAKKIARDRLSQDSLNEGEGLVPFTQKGKATRVCWVAPLFNASVPPSNLQQSGQFNAMGGPIPSAALPNAFTVPPAK